MSAINSYPVTLKASKPAGVRTRSFHCLGFSLFRFCSLSLESHAAACIGRFAGRLALIGRAVSPARYRMYLAQECATAGVDFTWALAGGRKRPLVLARWRAWKRLRDDGATLPMIGRVAAVDHSSVLHGLRRLSTMGDPS
jgi:hypothetical protein